MAVINVPTDLRVFDVLIQHEIHRVLAHTKKQAISIASESHRHYHKLPSSFFLFAEAKEVGVL